MSSMAHQDLPARSIEGLSKQLRRHERDDERALAKLDRRLRKIENRLLILATLVIGSGAANHLVG